MEFIWINILNRTVNNCSLKYYDQLVTHILGKIHDL